MPSLFRRVATLVVALALLAALGCAGWLLNVPYLIAAPGITLNTVGERDGEPVIQIDGRDHFEHDDGGLAMVTVQYSGGPDHRVNLFTVLTAWLRPSQAVLPEEVVYPPDSTVEEITETQNVQMDSSQQLAVAAALDQLDIEFEQTPLVSAVDSSLPAAGLLEPGDHVLEVDDEPVADQAEVVGLVRDREPGDPVDVTVERDGEELTATIETVADEAIETEGDPVPVIGVLLESDMEFPFDVDFSIGEIGGPSAGMMFALGIIDRLSEDDLTGGHYIAGSGTLQPYREEDSDETVWEVGAVSGIAQKMVSAQNSGAEYFLVAEGSCPQTHESVATEIDVIAIDTLDTAVEALETISTDGDVDSLSRCE